jgi:hypothetical protein
MLTHDEFAPGCAHSCAQLVVAEETGYRISERHGIAHRN